MNDNGHSSRHGAHAQGSRLRITSQATLHCLIGCSIGEILGLMIGVSVGIGLWFTLFLAVALAFFFGLALAVLPLVRGADMSVFRALRTIWLGEVVSIAVMELAMNLVDWWMGGMQVMSVVEPIFWISLVAAIPAGYAAAWPVNWWLIGRNLKHCH